MLTVSERKQRVAAAIEAAVVKLAAVAAATVGGAIEKAGGELVAMRNASSTTRDALTPELLAKVSDEVGFPVDITLATAALAEPFTDTPLDCFLASRGIELRKAHDAGPEDPHMGARVRRDGMLARGPAQLLAALADRLRADAAKAEAYHRGRGEDILAKAAGAEGAGVQDALAYARSIKPELPMTAPRPDRRDELRATRDKMRDLGLTEAAREAQEALLAEERRFAVSREVIPWGGTAKVDPMMGGRP